MTAQNLIFIENADSFAKFARIVRSDGLEYETARLHAGRYVHLAGGDGQLCYGGRRNSGRTLEFSTPERLARDCNARLYKTRAEFEAAAAAVRTA